MSESQSHHMLGLLISSILLGICNCKPVGFSYAKFSGPVSGPEKEVYLKDAHGRGYVDYVQKPDYSFAYGVDDPKTRVLQNRKESRHGDAVKGEYSVVDPDGTLRVVKYTADKKNGFQAEVITNGKSELHGQDVQQHHSAQYHPQAAPPPPPPPVHHHSPHDHSHEEHDHDFYSSHQEEPEPNYNQQHDAPVSAAYTSHTRHPPAPPANTQYHQNAYAGSGEDDEDEYDDGGESGEDDDDESGEDDDEEEDDY